MGREYTEAQKKASEKYQKERSQIKITVDKAQHLKYKEYAEAQGISLTQLIVNLLEGKIKRGV